MDKSNDVLGTIFKFIPSIDKSKVITSSKFYPNIELLSGIFNLDDIEVCNSFSEDNFNILIQNDNLDRQKLFKCVINRGLYKHVKILLNDKRNEKTIDPSVDNNYAFIWSLEKGNTKITKLLLKDRRVNPAVNDNYAIKKASRKGYLEIVKLLLNISFSNLSPNHNRVNPAIEDNYPIRLASLAGHTEIVKLLLKDSRVNPSANANQAFRWACIYRRPKIVKLLLKNSRVNPYDRDNEALKYVSAYGYTEIVKLLIYHSSIKTPKISDLKVFEIVLKSLK